MELPDFMNYSNKFSRKDFVEKDDLGVLVFVLKKVWTDIDPEIQVKARKRLSKWFDEDEIAEINDLMPNKEEKSE